MQRSYKLLVMAGVALVGAAVAVGTMIDRRQPLSSASKPVASAAEPTGVPTESASRQAADTEAGAPAPVQLPPSMRGTQIDGRLAVDANGHLVVAKSVREFFDYMLTGVGEMPLPELIARIQALIDAELQEPARSEARQILAHYLDYKTALYELEQEFGDFSQAFLAGDRMNNLEQRLQAVMALRRQIFDPAVVDAFFAQEEQMDRFTLERLRVQARDDLSEAEKAARVAALEQGLPDELRRQRQAAVAISQGVEIERQLLQAGAAPAEVQALREQAYGREAAERLARLDQEQQQWQQRLIQYREEKTQLQQAAMSEQDRAREVERLRERLFSPEERRRVEALDRIAVGS